MPAVCSSQVLNIGRPLMPQEIRLVEITVVPDGRGLPSGSGQVSAGAAVYDKSCLSCHGGQGTGKPQDQLLEGVGSLASGKLIKAAVSYWPAVAMLFVYTRRPMPIISPQSMTNDEVYAVTAHILSIEGVVPTDQHSMQNLSHASKCRTGTAL
jgi:mono/diheme cytochrome c family protein